MPTYEAARHFAHAKKIATLLDSQFKVFGVPIGLDPILGIIPGFGDILAVLFSVYLLWIGLQMGLPAYKLLLMIFNILVDTSLGILPVVGDVADVFFRSNLRNIKILEDHLRKDLTFVEGEVIP